MHSEQVSRGLACAAALCLFLTGLPVLLVLGVGWPGLQSLPSPSGLKLSLETGVLPSAFVIKSIALLLWIVWLQMATSTGIDLWAHIRGRVTPRSFLIPRIMRQISGHVIAGALLASFTLQNPATATAVPENRELLNPIVLNPASASPLLPPNQQNPQLETPSNAASTTDGDEQTVQQAGITANSDVVASPLTHTVSPNDNLREVAQRYLGNPNRWTEVFLLNQGRAQTDGNTLYDPAHLNAGWELVMPTDAHAPTNVQPPTNGMELADTTEVVIPQVTVSKGDSLWKLADNHLDNPEKWQEIYEANQHLINDPNIIQPGWELFLPTPETPPTPYSCEDSQDSKPYLPTNNHYLPANNDSLLETPPLQAQPTQSKARTPVMAYATATPTVVINVPTQDETKNPLDRQALLAIGGLGMFAGSFIWALAKLRQGKSGGLPDNRRPIAKDIPINTPEERLWACLDNDSTDFLDAFLSYLASHLDVTTTLAPRIVTINLRPTGMSLLLNAPATPPPGISTSDDQLTWEVPKQPHIYESLNQTPQGPSLLPNLIALGNVGNDEVLLNLAQTNPLSLNGNQQAIAEFATAIATQLASSHLADNLTVICIGCGQHLIGFERVKYAPNMALGLDLIARQQRETTALLGNSATSSSTQTNPNTHVEPIPTTVVIALGSINHQDATALLERCGNWACLVAQNLPEANYVAQFAGEAVALQPLGLWLNPHRISKDSAETIGTLTTAAKITKQLAIQAPAQAQNPKPPASSHALVHQNNTYAQHLNPSEASGEIWIKMLGPVEVSGISQPISSNRVLDIVAFLAAHPEGVDRDQLMANIWPANNPPSSSTFSNSLSKARSMLGNNPHGMPYLPRMDNNGVYRLLPEVRTDLHAFRELLAAGRADSGPCGTEFLAQALALVRGIPFTGGNAKQYRWADFGLRSEIEFAIDNTAHELAKRYLAANNPEEAKRAIITSLQVVGLCEECYRWRLKAAAHNPTEIRRIMRELSTALANEDTENTGLRQPHKDTQELYDQLISGHILFK